MDETIGIIGAGRLGQALARTVRRADRPVVIANSRGPESLASVVDSLGGGIVAGTTRDAVELDFTYHSREGKPWPFRLIDTAGIRKKGKTHEGAEKLSILKAMQAMARADVSLLLLDAVSRRDYPVITGVFLIVGVAVMVINLIVDLSYGLLDPKVRYR